MKNMHPNEQLGFALDRQIDRLIDGELPEVDRIDLLRKIETEPDGWRRCALAFLEAQSWREALRACPAEAFASLPGSGRLAGSKVRRRPVMVRYAALAAGMMLMFGLGWAWHGRSPESKGGELVAQADQPFSPNRTSPESEPSANVDNAQNSTASGAGKNALDSSTAQFRPNDYRTETQTGLASVKLKDGRRVQIPYQEVRLRYVGGRTY